MDKTELVRRLSRVLKPDCLLHEAEDLKPFECDGLTAYREVPMVVVLPENEAQVRHALRICYEARCAGVARGAGTGCPAGRCRILTASRWRCRSSSGILEIDPVARTARVQPGVRNLAISEATAAFGLYYAPDPSSQIACSIGGNVAENSGGVHCLKYGLTVHNILKVRIVTMEGRCPRDRLRWPRRTRLRSARSDHGLRGPARRDHRNHGQAVAQAGQGAGRACRLRLI